MCVPVVKWFGTPSMQETSTWRMSLLSRDVGKLQLPVTNIHITSVCVLRSSARQAYTSSDKYSHYKGIRTQERCRASFSCR